MPELGPGPAVRRADPDRPVLNVGAANALAACKLYAGKVPPTSLNLLLYMALVSMDKDAEPSWWEGHEILAINCLGRSEPITRTDRRAVERAITPLFAARAITTTRHSSGHAGRIRTVRYRLWLIHPAPDGKHRVPTASTRRKTSDAEASTRRKVVAAPDGNRRAKEEEEELEQERDDTHTGFELTDVEGARPAAADHERTSGEATGTGDGRSASVQELIAETRRKLRQPALP